MSPYSIQADELKRAQRELNRRAAEFEKNDRLGEASDCRRKMAGNYRRLAGMEVNVLESARLNRKALDCEALSQRKNGENGRQVTSESPSECGEAVDGLLLKDANVNWDDIGGMQSTKNSLKYAMGLQLARRPQDLSRVEIPSRILLYGPPGSGKTLLAAAAAKMLGASFFNVKVSDLLSKYFGESTKLISALYAKARDLADAGIAVIFIDEIESLVADRDKSDSGPERRIISTFLAELDGLAQKNTPSNVITITATNRPWDLDPAILSRMDLRILVDYPDEETREAIFQIHLEGKGHKLFGGLSAADLAKRSEGLTGRDIERLCKRATQDMMAECNPDIVQKVDDGGIREHILKHRPFTRKDFASLFVRKKGAGSSEVSKQRQRFQEWSERAENM
jgi:SpoVK/Ycf46/Vps4 family AAA+-type ATPase